MARCSLPAPTARAATTTCLVLLLQLAAGARLPAPLGTLNSNSNSDSGGRQYPGRPDAPRTQRPLIGILTQPGDPAPEGSSYIAASYVKWVEAGGARAVPLQYDLPERELRERFDAVNGVVLPGGGADLSPGHAFYDAAARLVRWAREANDRGGDYLPVWGTCLGLEALAIIAAGDDASVLSHTDAEDAAAPLLYTDEADQSMLLRALPPRVVRGLQDRPLAMENHAHGLLMTTYEGSARLRRAFSVLALSLDKQGLPYVAAMEGRNHPVWAVQFHPEKNAYEWATFLHIPHGADAVEVTQAFTNFFVDEARRSKHAPRDAAHESELLVYNWKPEFTGRREKGGSAEEEADFLQAYFFPASATAA